MTITRTVTRECNNTLYVLRKNDCNYALMKNDEMYYATKKGAIETVTLTLTSLHKEWKININDRFWIAPFNATYAISDGKINPTYKVRYEKGKTCFITSSNKSYSIIRSNCHHGDCDVTYLYSIVLDGYIKFDSQYASITLNGYIDNEGTFYAELPSDAITKE
ncbi:hypothetical protein [Veillonella montpellierensis]|uniref:hypothetical protein n=1 Tax=Veillonella montpellierensis TaxID=187328 RepID=UPI0023F6776F|nr:hypothetical protein [Veillonella montpellierensis]